MAEASGGNLSIEEKSGAIKERFSNIITLSSSLHDTGDHFAPTEGISQPYIQDQFDRFRLWAGHMYV